MVLGQAFKMAWKSIWGKKGRSALTILGVFIGIAAVMTIVSVVEGYRARTMAAFQAMGTGRIDVYVYNYMWDMEGNDISPDVFPDLYAYCGAVKEIAGITPNGNINAVVRYGAKSSEGMEYQYDDNWNLISAPPQLYYGSNQYSLCNNLSVARGRDLAWLDMENYSQVCCIGALAAKTFFGTANPVGKVMEVGGNRFTVVGVYASRDTDGSLGNSNMDNFIVFPYTVRRVLGGEKPREFVVKVHNSEDVQEVTTRLRGFLKGLAGEDSYYVSSNDSWQQQENEMLGLIGAILGGIAGISLLVGGIGIMNIMLVTVTERTREIGIRRAIGAQRSGIVAQFLIEAAMLCGIGGIVGIAVGTVGSVILSTALLQTRILPPVYVTLGAFALSVALGILFGSYPAATASKLQPVEALRAE